MAKFERFFGNVAGLFVVAIRSFCAAMLLMSCLGAVLGGTTYFILARYQTWYGVIGGLIALLEAIVVGVVWGGKRALTMTLIHGLKQNRIGKATVHLIFERLLPIDGEQAFGERGGIVTKTVERLPLAEAEKRLRAAVNAVLDESGETGGLTTGGRATGGLASGARRWLREKLIHYVEACTLARFRETGSEQGGVDLLKVQDELENSLDQWLVTKLTASLNLWTVLILVGLPAQVFATVLLIIAFLK